jgi:hypothetical protein
MDLFQTLRQTLIMFFLAFPMIIITLIGFFSVGTGNVGLLLMLLGQVTVVPIATALLNVVGFILRQTVPATDLNQLVPSAPHTAINYTVFPSYWVAHTTFFLGYLFWSAYSLYSLEPVSINPEDDWRVENRKSRASMIMFSSLFFLLFMVGLRYMITNAERLPGVLVGLVGFGALAYGWQQAMTAAGAKAADVFGIVQQMIPTSDDPNITFCVPRA